MSQKLPPLPHEVMGVLIGFSEDRQLNYNTGPSPEDGYSVHINTAHGPLEFGYFTLVDIDGLAAAELVRAKIREKLTRGLRGQEMLTNLMRDQLAQFEPNQATMLIEATFTGADSSLGYQRGQRYTLRLASHNGTVVQREDGSGKCPYASLSAFLMNWTNVQVLSRPLSEDPAVPIGTVTRPKQ
jgi:hypothetical protein